jgi:hypothetical protein
MATAPQEVEGRNVSGQQAALLIGGLLVLLVVLWFLFLRGGGDETEPTALPTAVPTAVPTEEPAEVEEDEDPNDGPLETFEVFAAKDPFEPLIDESSGGGGVTTGGAVVSPGTGTSTSEPGPGGSVEPGTDNTGDDVGGHRVSLIDVFVQGGNQVAQVRVDGTVYTVEEGETFAENFQVLSISGDCATMLFGDDQFTLCVGQEILK